MFVSRNKTRNNKVMLRIANNTWLALMVVVMFLSYNLSAIAANPSTLTEQNKAIALRLAQDGWGTQKNWGQVWDEL
ncbi:MAG: hypothetical protein RLZZ04_2564, partial [Cyanobacteriota bacterium]